MITYGGVAVEIHIFLTSAMVESEQTDGTCSITFREGPPDTDRDGLQSRSSARGEGKILDPRGTRTPAPVVRPVVSRYADCIIPASCRRCI